MQTRAKEAGISTSGRKPVHIPQNVNICNLICTKGDSFPLTVTPPSFYSRTSSPTNCSTTLDPFTQENIQGLVYAYFLEFDRPIIQLLSGSKVPPVGCASRRIRDTCGSSASSLGSLKVPNFLRGTQILLYFTIRDVLISSNCGYREYRTDPLWRL